MGDPDYTPLKQYLQRSAKAHQSASLARTYGFIEEGTKRVRAYITIICGEIEVSVDHAEEGVEYPYERYPAIKIARLAVDHRLRGSGLGRKLCDLALAITKDVICRHVGCRFLVVDSKQGSIDFYEKCGFRLIDTQENKDRDHPVMFIDLHRTAA